MRLIALLPIYILWHYTRAILDFKKIVTNFLWFVFNYFSIEILIKTLVAPWKRLSKDETAHPTFFSNFIINILMRSVGILIRTLTIFSGLFSLILIFLLSIFGFLIWLILPFLVPAIFLYGLSFFIV